MEPVAHVVIVHVPDIGTVYMQKLLYSSYPTFLDDVNDDVTADVTADDADDQGINQSAGQPETRDSAKIAKLA